MGEFFRLLLLILTEVALFRDVKPLITQGPFLSPAPASPKATTRSVFLDLIVNPTPAILAIEEQTNMIEFQIDIEKLFHKNQLFPRIKREFEDIPNLRSHLLANKIQADFGFDLLIQMVLHKRADLPTLVGILRKHFNGDCQAAADELLKCAQADLVDWNPTSRQFIIRFDISADVQADLDRYQYPLPMVVEPLEITTNRDTGYYTHQNSVILKHNHHDRDVCLDHLNRANRVKFKLDMDTATTIKNSWKSLDKPKADEDYKSYQRRVKAFDKYNRTTHDVLDHLGLASGGEFYLTHRYDKRGRTYSQGYHVQYQGPTWNKAVVQFANEEVAI